jgi:dGTPase
MTELRDFMFERVYLGAEARREHQRIETVLRTLFDHYCDHPDRLPVGVGGATATQRVTDYLAGMTDRFCIREFEALSVPRSFA